MATQKTQHNTPAGSYFEKVMKAIYEPGVERPPTPMSSREALKRHGSILAKMRRAGISEEDIQFLGDFYQADAMHVWKLMELKAGRDN